MSVGSLKRLILLLNVAAILGIGGTAYGFWGHRASLQEQRTWPDFHFKPASASGSAAVGQVTNLGMTLGKFPVAPTKTTEVKKEPEVSPIQSVLQNLGEIIGAVVFYAPYDEHGFQPSITFQLKGGGIRTLARGEAIETQPHPDFGKIYPVPYRYKFVGCERDENDLAVTYFLFDMKCDGTDIQKVKWLGDIEIKPQPLPGELPTGAEDTVSSDEMIIVSEKELEKRAREREEARAKAAASIKPVTPETPKAEPVKPIRAPDGVPDSLGDEEGGIWVASDEGSEYIRENWKTAVEDAQTTTYRDPKTGEPAGVLVTKIRPGSVANKLGIYPDDVILSINGRTVTKKSQAISIVRDELDNRKRNILEVGILRNGRKISKRYDARDPETRRNAKEAFRDR